MSIAKDIIASKKWQMPKLVYYKDGIATTVSVDQWRKTVSLKNNGKVDASNDDDMPTQIMVGLLPLLFCTRRTPRPSQAARRRRRLRLGRHRRRRHAVPDRHAEVVELEPAVIEAARTSSTP